MSRESQYDAFPVIQVRWGWRPDQEIGHRRAHWKSSKKYLNAELTECDCWFMENEMRGGQRMISKCLDWEISWISCDIISRGTNVDMEELRAR